MRVNEKVDPEHKDSTLQLTIGVTDEFHDFLDGRHLTAAERSALNRGCVRIGNLCGHGSWFEGPDNILQCIEYTLHLWVVVHGRIGCYGLLYKIMSKLRVCSQRRVRLAAVLGVLELDRTFRMARLVVDRWTRLSRRMRCIA